MENKEQGYSISYKNISGKNLLVYTFRDEDQLVNYQLEMLAKNQIKGLLKSDVIRINGVTHLQFDITSLVPVKKLFERRKFSRKDFICIIRQITELLAVMERYLLDSSGIVFDSTYIFVDPQTLELRHVYLPTRDRHHGSNAIKEFLLDVIINDIRFLDEPSDNFIQRLIEILKDPDFQEISLKKYLNEIDRINKVHINIAGSIKDLPENAASPQLSWCPIEIQKVNEPVQVKKSCYPAKSYIILFSVIGTLVIFCIALILSGILSPSNPDSLLSLFGFVLITGAVIYLVYSKLFTPDKKIEKIIEKKTDTKEPFIVGRYVNKEFSEPVFANGGIFKITDVKKETVPMIERDSASSGTQSILFASGKSTSETRPFFNNLDSPSEQDRTVILNMGGLNIPYLKRLNCNSTETIPMKKFPFMLGRLEGQVDYCIKNPAVGKMHAEITKTEEGYFISDMNSRNGTMINGVRVEPIKENMIKNGDRITLGNEEFIFYCGNTG
ncbi:MAG: FHA domain-containing protein [Clostridiaceae bacterium]|nr:FHA domain-containing protein [Clostridiaceae bacterium]